MNSNVYHLVGPSSVKHATSRIKQVLEEEKPKYFLRVDIRITPHARTLRKARENVRLMVAEQVSPAQIKRYFVQWARWWVKTANTWDFQSLVVEFIGTCWQKAPAKLATDVLYHYIT